jgi:hypothetical protein
MENLPAGLNGNKVTAGQNGKSCSRAKCQLHYNAAGLNASWPKIRQANTPLA